jgi:carbamoyl-phosphate synthase small subunit
VNLNDGVVEGLRLVEAPAFSVQYHPEAAPGPHDAAGLFTEFCELMGGDRA